MKKIASPAEFRSIEDGEWYWIPRRVFEDYASKIGVVGLALYNAYSSYARFKRKKIILKEIKKEKMIIVLLIWF